MNKNILLQISTKVMPTKVIIVFSDQSDLWFLKYLKNGYRHCFAFIEQSKGWIVYDPLSNQSIIQYLGHLEKDKIMTLYSNAGCEIIETIILTELPEKMAPILPYTCVEAIKRLLGIHRWFLLTPWQLFCHLKEQNTNKYI